MNIRRTVYGYARLKRVLDIVAVLVLLLPMFPVLIACAVAVKLGSPGPVLFRQLRLGEGEVPFRILKFRTMRVESGRIAAQTFGHSEGVTREGRVLRRLKLDELPQLLNVLQGHMSLVGPRPSLPELAETLPGWARHRYSVPPGLTGLAQTNGNVALDWETRCTYDVRYIATRSLRLDLAILLRTLIVIPLGEARFVRRR